MSFEKIIKKSIILVGQSKCRYFDLGKATMICLASGSLNWEHGRKSFINHYVKSVRIRSYPGPYSVRMRENTDQKNPEYGYFPHSDLFKTQQEKEGKLCINYV